MTTVPGLSRIHAVLFDLFHTLVSLEVARTPGPTVPELLGVEPETWWRIWTADSDDYVLGRAALSEVLPSRALLANPAVTDERVAAALAARPARFRHVLKHVEPETLAGLARLRRLGLRLGLVSNCGRDEVESWPDSPLAPLFDATVFSCDVGLRKPDPAIYLLAAARLRAESARCLFIGDGGSDELAGARAAGMTPVLLTRHLEVMAPHRVAAAAALADLRLNTVSDLARLLAERQPPAGDAGSSPAG
ncbi:HAD family hydrolase [candidate division WOR-3 bacterium]|nr:HAD family hydrolase [candidate division WOR-3 bacterium]